MAAFYFGGSRRLPINSVAVLPFANASADPSMEYLSDGITEGVIDRLSGLPNVKVISRTSAFRYKQREIEPQKVARELGVEALGHGQSRFSEATISRSVPNSWTHARTSSFGVSSTAESSLTSRQSSRRSQPRYAGNLRIRLTSEEKTRLTKPYATNPEAYQLYLKGRYHANQITAEGYKKGIEYLSASHRQRPRLCSGVHGSG